MDTHDLGKRYYWHHAWYVSRRHPFHTVDRTVEIDEPYRIGRCHVLSIPGLKFALVVGKWVGEHEDEDTAILDALRGREVPL